MAAELAQLVQRAAREDTSLEMPSILWLEHLNLVCGRREATEAFYLHALGCTLDTNRRDANLGQQQFHLNATQFAWEDCGEHVRVTGPWGNVFLIWDSEAMMEDVNHFVAPPRMVSMNEV